MESLDFLSGLLEGALTTILIIGAIALITGIFALVCQWKIFQKMGEPGWKCLIPYYCNWVLCAHTWSTPLVSLAIIIPGVIAWFCSGTIATILNLITSVMYYITNWKKYQRFGKSTGFCVLGIFFPLITDAICAFGKAEYSETV